jgi:cytochrome c5
VVPGDSAASVIYQVQQAGGHLGQLSAEDITVLGEWIDAGAPETGGGTAPTAGGVSWDGTVAALFDPACTGCHGAGLQSGGIDLSSYAATVAGGASGAGVVPGDSAASVLVQVQEAGGHPGQLSAEALAVVMEWIDAGAAESGGGGPAPPTAAGVSWDGEVAVVFDPACTGCHGAGLQSGGVDLSSYSAAVAVTVPGDAAGSVIVQVMEAGGHPGQLSDEHLALVKEWIDGGAAESDGGGTTPQPVASGTTWEGSLAGIFDPTCTACHGANLQSGGLDLSSYAAAVAGGGGGAGVVPGDAAASVIVQVMESGGHPCRLSDKHLALVKEWIDAGASER